MCFAVRNFREPCGCKNARYFYLSLTEICAQAFSGQHKPLADTKSALTPAFHSGRPEREDLGLFSVDLPRSVGQGVSASKKHRRDQVEENNGVGRAPLISFGQDHDVHKLRISQDEFSSINMDGEGKDSYHTEFESAYPPHSFSPLDSSLGEEGKRQTETLEHEASLNLETSLSRPEKTTRVAGPLHTLLDLPGVKSSVSASKASGANASIEVRSGGPKGICMKTLPMPDNSLAMIAIDQCEELSSSSSSHLFREAFMPLERIIEDPHINDAPKDGRALRKRERGQVLSKLETRQKEQAHETGRENRKNVATYKKRDHSANGPPQASMAHPENRSTNLDRLMSQFDRKTSSSLSHSSSSAVLECMEEGTIVWGGGKTQKLSRSISIQTESPLRCHTWSVGTQTVESLAKGDTVCTNANVAKPVPCAQEHESMVTNPTSSAQTTVTGEDHKTVSRTDKGEKNARAAISDTDADSKARHKENFGVLSHHNEDKTVQFDCIQMSCDQNEIKSNTAEIDLNLEKAERDFAEKLQAEESEKGRSCMEGMNAKEKVAPDTPAAMNFAKAGASSDVNDQNVTGHCKESLLICDGCSRTDFKNIQVGFAVCRIIYRIMCARSPHIELCTLRLTFMARRVWQGLKLHKVRFCPSKQRTQDA